MLYRFGDFELDRSTVELRRNGAVVPIEPQVFALLALLAENRERLVSRDEIVEKVWDGRIVSDSALDSRIKSARRVRKRSDGLIAADFFRSFPFADDRARRRIARALAAAGM